MACSYSHPYDDDLPVIFSLPFLSISSQGTISSNLAVVTEDGRRLRIIGARHPDGDVQRAEITVAEEEA